jgi:hypothetical protein
VGRCGAKGALSAPVHTQWIALHLLLILSIAALCLQGDAAFDPIGNATDATLPFTRSAYDLDGVGARIPVNLESHFLDASTVRCLSTHAVIS